VFWWVDSYLRAAITQDLKAFPRAKAAAQEYPEMQLPL
jgi:hypothetical protein